MTSAPGTDFLYEPGHPPSIPAHLTVAEYRRQRNRSEQTRWRRVRARVVRPGPRP